MLPNRELDSRPVRNRIESPQLGLRSLILSLDPEVEVLGEAQRLREVQLAQGGASLEQEVIAVVAREIPQSIHELA